jgi:MOSC domain-containing protein YiiM
MRGSILQINISNGGVPKRAVPQAEVTPEGIVGDSWAHSQYHGGPRKALLVITSEGIEEVTAQGFALFPGALGENLTTRGLDRRLMRIGQRYQTGEVIFELTKIRWPCATLDVYGSGIQAALYDTADPASARWGLSGFYASVVQTGRIRTGDAIELLDAPSAAA